MALKSIEHRVSGRRSPGGPVFGARPAHYPEFVEAVGRPGSRLGEQFLAKLFQLRLRVPDLDATTSVQFGRTKLGLNTNQATDAGLRAIGEREAKHRIDAASSLDQKIDVLNRVTDAGVVRRLAVDVGRYAASDAGQAELRHELDDHLPLVDPSPRSVIRFLNSYAIARLSIDGNSARPTVDQLARWSWSSCDGRRSLGVSSLITSSSRTGTGMVCRPTTLIVLRSARRRSTVWRSPMLDVPP